MGITVLKVLLWIVFWLTVIPLGVAGLLGGLGGLVWLVSTPEGHRALLGGLITAGIVAAIMAPWVLWRTRHCRRESRVLRAAERAHRAAAKVRFTPQWRSAQARRRQL
jgi:hypothetical protein